MYQSFSKNLYSQGLDREYKLVMAQTDDISLSHHWAMQNVEMTTLVNINVADGEKINWAAVLAASKLTAAYGNNLLDKVGQVTNVFIIAGGPIPTFEGAEEYFGQPVYSVFWHVNLATGEVTAAKGQPKKIFDLREMIRSSVAAKNAKTPHTFSEIGRMAITRAPAPKYSHPMLTYAIITINAVVLVLMYLEGFPQDMLVPMRFGAIYPPLILIGGQWYRLFTSMFIHFGLAHFASNSLGLVIFGSRVERYFGRSKFLMIYICTGLIGSLASLFLSQAYSAGASGAIYGLVGFMFIYTRITKRTIEFINWYVMFIYIGIGMSLGFTTAGIDNFAHLGGLLSGAVFGAVLAKREKFNCNV